jgi:uncharacterized membrane protein
MSSDVPVQLVVSAFQAEDGAKAALDQLRAAKKEKLIGIESAAVLRKDEDGKVHIKQTVDFGGKKGATIGGVAGAAIGVIAGPALVVPAGVGALIGGLAGKLRDTGFSKERLERLAASLTPGSSAIIAVVEHKWVGDIERAMAEAGADMVTEGLAADIAEQLEAGGEVAYTAIATKDGVAGGRLASGEGTSEGSAVVVGEDAAVGARFVATDKGYEVIPEDGAESRSE